MKPISRGSNYIPAARSGTLYDLDDSLLIVATDRISAFDVIMPTPIPDKGIILTQLSVFWLQFLSDIVAHHLISTDPRTYPAACQPFVNELGGRSMRVRQSCGAAD